VEKVRRFFLRTFVVLFIFTNIKIYTADLILAAGYFHDIMFMHYKNKELKNGRN